MTETSPGKGPSSDFAEPLADEREMVVGGLASFVWEDTTAAECETAVEEVNQVVGGYASLLTASDENPEAFPEADVALWEAQWKAFIARRLALRPDQPEVIAETRRAAAEALQYLLSPSWLRSIEPATCSRTKGMSGFSATGLFRENMWDARRGRGRWLSSSPRRPVLGRPIRPS